MCAQKLMISKYIKNNYRSNENNDFTVDKSREPNL